jgi:hypothetical protein
MERQPIQPLVTAAAATAEPVWPPTASTTAAVRDLTYASALLRVIENMHDQPNVGTLLSAVAEHGTTLISADGIAIIRSTAGRWRPVIIRATHDEPDVVSVQRVVKLLAAEGWLQHFQRVDDLGQDDRWAGLSVSSNLRTWRSLLIAPSERLRQADLPMTFVWWVRRTGAFADHTHLAELFVRTAGVAIENVKTRDNLAQAVVARHRAGVAQGILMSRLGCLIRPSPSSKPIPTHQPQTTGHRRRGHPDR